jgi:DNA-binding transcriptional MerR regulator
MIARHHKLDILPLAFGEPRRSAAPSRQVQIGPLSEMLGITRRAIRHYEQQGLVEPIRGPGGARLFDETARRRLEWIAKLRLTGIGLKDIEEILSLGTRGGPRRQLQLTIEKLETRAAQLRANVREIEAAAELMRLALEASPPDARISA